MIPGGTTYSPKSQSCGVCVCQSFRVRHVILCVSVCVFHICVCVSLHSWLCACVVWWEGKEGRVCTLPCIHELVMPAWAVCLCLSACLSVSCFWVYLIYVCMCSKPICLRVFSPQIPWLLLLEHFSLTHSATPSCGHVLNLVISEKGSTSEVSGSHVSDSDTPSLQLSRALTFTPWVFYILGASSLSWLPFPFSLGLQVLSLPLLSPHTLSVLTSHFYLTQLADPQQCSWALLEKNHIQLGGWMSLPK